MHRRVHRFRRSFINWYYILVISTLRLSGINLFVCTNWNDRTASLRRDNSSGRIPESMTNFPKPVARSGGSPYSPGACRRAPGLFISQHALFYHGSTSFVVRTSRTGRDETKTGTNLQENVSRACLSLWPRGINNISRGLLEFLVQPAPHGRRGDPPSKRSRHWRVPFARRSWWIRGIRWEQRDVGLTWKACLLFWWGIIGWIPGVDA